MLTRLLLTDLPLLPLSASAQGKPAVTPQAEGFRGIWFEFGQKSEYGSKYSGGLGTYTANHVPMAHYVKKVTWAKQREVTESSPRNYSYARRPRNANPDFYAY